ncbi:MAG: thiolase family protein [Treponemataceae bacterium]
MREAVIVSAARTPVGKVRGSLASVPAHKLGALVVKEAVRRAKIDPAEIEEVIFGNLMNHEVNNMARVVALEAGLPVEVPGVTLDRQCGTSLNSVAYAAMYIEAGYADVIVAGGVESDSRRPYILDKPTMAYQMMPPQFSEILLAPPQCGNMPMGITAENLAVKYKLTRQECDEFSLASHRKGAAAWESGYFADQIVPVTVDLGKGKTFTLDFDEPLRKDANMEALSKLQPAFKSDGIVTAGNSSPQSDGAGAVVVMERKKAEAMGAEILAVFKGFTAVGVDPSIMGIGPVPATRKLLKRAGLTIDQIDLIELNEAFAAQSIPCVRELGIDMNKLNVNGGAIALGHPLAGSGAILTTKLLYEMRRRDVRRGIVTFCCGGGQGVAALFERI